jgi:hypothetical protein
MPFSTSCELCDASVDTGRQVLQLGREVSLYRPGERPGSSRLTLASDKVIPVRYESVVTARLEGPLEAVNGLVEPEMTTSHKGLFLAMALVRARHNAPNRIVNVSDQDQVLLGGTTLSL